MAIIKLKGMKEKNPYLAKSLGNKEYKPLSSNTIVGYPHNFQFKEFEIEGKKQWEIQMQFAANGKSHLLSLGKSELAKSIINSLRTIADPIQDEEFEIAFYQNKKGYGSVYITRQSNDSHPEWHIGIDEKNTMITRTTNKAGEVTIDSYDWDMKVKSMIDELNAYWPASTATRQSQSNALDDLDEEEETTKRTPLVETDLDIMDVPF